MTRGQIAVITDKCVLTSLEFNGDMYQSGHGKHAVTLLKKVNDIGDYHFAVAKFNKDHHHYNDEQIVYRAGFDVLDFTTDYYKNWFSDYVYIKNISKNNVNMKVEYKEKPTNIELAPGQILVLYFGTLRKITK